MAKPRYFVFKNLSEQNVTPGEPWLYSRRDLVPPGAFTSKKERDAWATNPNTDYQIYTAYEGLNSSIRISKDNPPAKVYAFVADYDVPIGDVELSEALVRMKPQPNRAERSLSGNARLLWALEEGMPIASPAFCRFIIDNLESLIPINELGGLDRGALDPSRCFTNGSQWTHVHDVPISADRIRGWLMKLSDRYNWSQEPGVSVPIPAVIERLREMNKYPRLAEWQTDFVLGAQGPSFWVEGSLSPKSAIIREKGMQTFAGHAHKSFFPWAELLGADWVKNFETDRMGRAVKNIHFDSKTYFVQGVDGRWHDENKENLINELVVSRGLKRDFSKRAGENCSEVETAINYIRHRQRVVGAASFAFFPKGIIEFNSGTYLNTHTRDVLQPVSGTTVWGPDGGFPWLSKFLDQFFDPAEQLDYVLAWLSRYYGSCYRRAPLGGQNAVLVGPVNCGKTFFNRAIIGALVGGYSEAKKFLMGECQFNSQLFDYGLWCIDDGSIASSAHMHRYFSEMFKLSAANRDMESHAKFQKPSQVGWLGRLMVTCNDDAESIRMIPRMDISIKEKLQLWRAAKRSIEFPGDEEMKAILARELPYFARFLLDYIPKAHCVDADPRFGVKAYHEARLVAQSDLSDSAFNEILDAWMQEHFFTREKDADCWEGTALNLRSEICKDPLMFDVMRAFDIEEIKRRLSKLSTGGLFKIEVLNGDTKRQNFRIHRETHAPRRTKPSTPPPQDDAKFGKQ